MLKEKLNLRKQVDLKLDGEDWDLYTNENEEECNRVADALNKRFNEAVNMNLPREATEREMRREMRLYRHWGADDTEPHYVLERLLDMVYE